MSLPGCNKNHWQNSVKPNQPSKGEFFFFTLMEYSVCSVHISWWYILYVTFSNTACLATMWRWVMMISLNKWPFSCWWQSSGSSSASTRRMWCCLTGGRDWISSTDHLAALWANHFLSGWEMTVRNHEEQTLAPRPLCVCDLTLSCCRYRRQHQPFRSTFMLVLRDVSLKKTSVWLAGSHKHKMLTVLACLKNTDSSHYFGSLQNQHHDSLQLNAKQNILHASP